MWLYEKLDEGYIKYLACKVVLQNSRKFSWALWSNGQCRWKIKTLVEGFGFSAKIKGRGVENYCCRNCRLEIPGMWRI